MSGFADLGGKQVAKGIDFSDLGGTPSVQSTQQDQGNFVTNFLPSLGKNVGDFGNALVNVLNPNPQQNTVANLAKLGVGAMPGYRDMYTTINTGVQQANQTPQGKQMVSRIQPLIDAVTAPGKAADSVGKYYVDRYSHPVKTFNSDPVGVLLDASAVLDGGASIAGETGRLGPVLRTASDVTNPITMAGKGIAKTGKIVVAPFRGSYNPEIADLAKAQGVDLPASAMTNSRIIQQGEALTSKAFFGQSIIDKIQAAKQQLADLAQQVTEKVNTSPDLLQAGEVARTGFDTMKKAFQDKMNALYGEIIPKIKNQPADATNTIQALNTIIENGKNNLGNNPARAYYEQLQSIIKPLHQMTQKGMLTPEQQLTAQKLRATLQDVGNKLKNPQDPIANADQGALKQLYGALSDDLHTTISNYDPAVADELKKVNSQYAEGKKLYNSPIGQYIQNKDPEQIVNQMFKPNSVTNINRIKKIVGDQGFSQLQGAFMSKLFKSSLDKNGILDIDKLSTNLKKFDEPTKNAMFSPQQLQELEDTQKQLGNIKKLQEAIKKGTRVSEGSQTAFLEKLSAAPALFFHNPWIFGAGVGADYLASRLFSTDKGIDYLTKGSKDVVSPVGRGMQKASQPLNLLRMITPQNQ